MMEDGSTLPDLNNEKTGEQILFEQKVFRCNEAFVRKVNDLIKWHKAPADCRPYPKYACNNRNKYKKHARRFTYDAKKGILFKKIEDSYGISK